MQKINSAYVTIGLLYGDSDFTQSIDIAARCGQDADCNPATVGGVLGVMLGYDAIPPFWLTPLQEIEELNFENTEMSLHKAYTMSYNHALQNIEKAGGKTKGQNIEIPFQAPVPVKFEQNFENCYPIARTKKLTSRLPMTSTSNLPEMALYCMATSSKIPKLTKIILTALVKD